MQLHLSIPGEDAAAVSQLADAWRCQRAAAARALIAEALQARGLIAQAAGTRRADDGQRRTRRRAA